MKVVMVGAGNLATRLSLAMSRLPQIQIMQVYSHTQIHAEELAGCLNAVACDDPTQIRTDADLYLFSLKDTALEGIAASIPANGGLWIHTAGSMPMELFANYTKRYGVLYPLQTFSNKERLILPLFLFSWNANKRRIVQYWKAWQESFLMMCAFCLPNCAGICIWLLFLLVISPTTCMFWQVKY